VAWTEWKLTNITQSTLFLQDGPQRPFIAGLMATYDTVSSRYVQVYLCMFISLSICLCIYVPTTTIRTSIINDDKTNAGACCCGCCEAACEDLLVASH
jgi:hypothetical protein